MNHQDKDGYIPLEYTQNIYIINKNRYGSISIAGEIIRKH